MIPDEKIEFPGQNFLRFFYKVKLFPDEILVIDDLPAPDTYQVMVMVIPLPGFQLVTSLAVRHVQSVDEPGAVQEFKGPVNGRQADPGESRMKRGINVFGAQMLGRILQEIQDSFPGGGPTRTVFPHSQWSMMRSAHFFLSYR
jgi:hypothetical protein